MDVWMEDLTLLAQALESQEFAEYLDAPQVPADAKIAVIKDSLGDSVGPLALNLLSLLASRSIVPVMPGIAEQYQRMLDGHRGVEQAEIVSAVSLDDERRRKITDLLRGMVGREVRVSPRVDPGIIGGILVRVGDLLIDGSTRTRVERLRRDLVEQL